MGQESGVSRGGGGGGHGGGHGGGGGHWGGHPGGGHWGGTPSRPGGARWNPSPGIPWGATEWGPDDPYFVEPPPITYGDPVPMTPDSIAAGQYALEESGTYPAFGYAKDGGLFMFTVEGGALVARPYLPPATGLGDDNGILPFLPPGLTRALGLPPPEAAHLLTLLGYVATLMGVRTFQTAMGLPDTGTVDAVTLDTLHRLVAAAGLSGPMPNPQPTGLPIAEVGVELFRSASHKVEQELKREIEDVKRQADGSLGEPPPIGFIGDPPPLPVSSGPQPTGISIKSIETPGYLQDAPIFKRS